MTFGLIVMKDAVRLNGKVGKLISEVEAQKTQLAKIKELEDSNAEMKVTSWMNHLVPLIITILRTT